jgi:hypothetical protein
MRQRTLFLLTILLCGAIGTALAADVWMGTWKVNTTKSKYSPGPAPKATTTKYEAAGDNMKVTVDGTDADGKALHNEWTGKFDGKDYAVKGDPDTDMRSYKKVDDSTMEIVGKKAGKVTTTTRSVYSKDGKTRTSTATGTNAKGQKVNNTIVYDKQ